MLAMFFVIIVTLFVVTITVSQPASANLLTFAYFGAFLGMPSYLIAFVRLDKRKQVTRRNVYVIYPNN
jgi:hypothetical protein